jgi:hypothetical protein
VTPTGAGKMDPVRSGCYPKEVVWTMRHCYWASEVCSLLLPFITVQLPLLRSNENWMKNAKQKTSNGKCSEEAEDQMTPVEINDEVVVPGQMERYVVVSLDGSFAKLQMFADDKQTMERRYWVHLVSVPIQDLTLIGKNHTRPAKFKLIP